MIGRNESDSRMRWSSKSESYPYFKAEISIVLQKSARMEKVAERIDMWSTIEVNDLSGFWLEEWKQRASEVIALISWQHRLGISCNPNISDSVPPFRANERSLPSRKETSTLRDVIRRGFGSHKCKHMDS